jgi:hypothetical protein
MVEGRTRAEARRRGGAVPFTTPITELTYAPDGAATRYHILILSSFGDAILWFGSTRAPPCRLRAARDLAHLAWVTVSRSSYGQSTQLSHVFSINIIIEEAPTLARAVEKAKEAFS